MITLHNEILTEFCTFTPLRQLNLAKAALLNYLIILHRGNTLETAQSYVLYKLLETDLVKNTVYFEVFGTSENEVGVIEFFPEWLEFSIAHENRWNSPQN